MSSVVHSVVLHAATGLRPGRARRAGPLRPLLAALAAQALLYELLWETVW